MVVVQTENANQGDGAAANSGSHSTDGTAGWREWKERGKHAYLKGEYASALQAYSQAAQRQQNPTQGANSCNDDNSPSSTILEKQILLSNMIACRLKLGGAPQSEAAVSTAKRCIALNPLWPKGHMRLAEAYQSLAAFSDGPSGCDASDRAREALQRVIDLDPESQPARDMMATLDGDRPVGDNGRGIDVPEPSAPPESMDETRYNNTQGAVREEHPTLRRRTNNSNGNNSSNNNNSSSSNSNNNNNHNNPRRENSANDVDIEDDNNVYENYNYTPSWQDRLALEMQRAKSWYYSLSEDQQSIGKVIVGFVVLYVAFGGRFGLEYVFSNSSDAPYRNNNAAYEDFYQTGSEPHRNGYHSTHSSRRSSRSGGSNQNRDSSYQGSNQSQSWSIYDVHYYFKMFYFFVMGTLFLIGRADLIPRRAMWRYGGWGGNRFRRQGGWGGNGFWRQGEWGGNRNGYRRRGGMWGW